jgi:tRNA (uracil-5-)-methyltransferase TRM9
MDDSTITRLNQINQAFYRITADEFDQTRGRPWPGWVAMLPHLEALRDGRRDAAGRPPLLAVLDVGCGNGRLGAFLAESLPDAQLDDHGMDADVALLAHARTALEPFRAASAPVIVTLHLESRDIITAPPDSGLYDLVALFGVMHHIPGGEQRRTFIRALADRVAPGGLLAFACWRFHEYARFRERIVPWPDDLAEHVEEGDYLLDWRRGTRALRYCHHVGDAEHAALVVSSGLTPVATYRADGRTGDANRYTILKRP